MNTVYKPIATNDRLEIVDFLRGFALLGILMVNLPLMNAPFTTEMGEFTIWTDKINSLATDFIRFFFTGKFYVLFSLLFGIGFYFFIKKVEAGNKAILSVFRLRLFWLLVFGILHVLFLWYGDILIIYALIGFVLLLFRNVSNKGLIIWAIVLILIPIILVSGLAGLMHLISLIPEAAAEIDKAYYGAYLTLKELTENALVVYPNGTFAEIINMRLEEYSNMGGVILYFAPNVLAMFLVGMLLARKGVFQNLNQNRRFFKKLLFICLPIGLAFNILFLYSVSLASMTEVNYFTALYIIGSGIGGPAMCFVYIALIVLLISSRLHLKFFRAISDTGKMALTNYLSQSIICTTLFFSYGFGLYGKVNIWQGILITITVYSVQVIWSHIWLKYYRFGPMEWVWRSLTYRKVQKLRR